MIVRISVDHIEKLLLIIPLGGGFDLHALASQEISPRTRNGMRIEIYLTLMSMSVSVSMSEFVCG